MDAKDIDAKELIKRLIFFRNRAKLTKRKLSILIGKAPSYMAHLENSQAFTPSFEALCDILFVCGVTLEEFFSPNYENYERDKELREIIQNAQTDKKDLALSVLKSR